MIAGLSSGFSGVAQLSLDKLFVRIQRFNQAKLCKLHKLPFSSQLVSTRWYLTTSPKYLSVKCSVSGKANGGIGFEGESHAYPFWLSFIKEAFWALRSLLAFLFEQPSQLKHIEWPTFQSTSVVDIVIAYYVVGCFVSLISCTDHIQRVPETQFKTATLTLVLVALFIISLASIDSALCFLLSLWLRRKA